MALPISTCFAIGRIHLPLHVFGLNSYNRNGLVLVGGTACPVRFCPRHGRTTTTQLNTQKGRVHKITLINQPSMNIHHTSNIAKGRELLYIHVLMFYFVVLLQGIVVEVNQVSAYTSGVH